MSYDWKQRDPEGYARWESGYGFLERTENMTYTHKDIVSMRRAIAEEVAGEMRAKGLDRATTDYVNFDTVEDRLRTYMQAGITADDLKASVLIEPIEPFDVGQYIIEGASK